MRRRPPRPVLPRRRHCRDLRASAAATVRLDGAGEHTVGRINGRHRDPIRHPAQGPRHHRSARP